MNVEFEKLWGAVQSNDLMYSPKTVAYNMYRSGLLRAAEIAEGMEGSWADLAWDEVCQDIATTIRKEAGDDTTR